MHPNTRKFEICAAIAAAIGALLMLVWPAAAQTTETPIVSTTPGEGLPSFGFRFECSKVRVTVLTATPFHGTYDVRCRTAGEILHASFNCGPDQPGNGEIIADETGEYTGFTDITVRAACQLEGPTGKIGLRCGDDNNYVTVILPEYGTWESTVTCDEPQG